MRTLVLLAVLAVCSSHAVAQSVPELMKQGLSLVESGDRSGAKKIFEQIIQQNPMHGPARLLLGQISFEQENWQQAQQHLEIAVQAKPQRLQLAWELLGTTSLFLGNTEKALQCYDEALALQPTFPAAAIGRAKALILLRKDESALSELQKIPSADADLLRAELLIYLDRAKEAESILQKLAPGQEPAKLLLLAISNDRDAEQKLKIAIGSNIALPAAYAALGIRLRPAATAETLFRIASEIRFDPVWLLFQGKGDTAPPMTIPMDRAQRLSQDNPQEAQLALQEILARKPHHVPALLLKADIFEQSGNPWDALLLYKGVLQWLPDVPSIQSRMAKLMRTMGLFESAECMARKALQSNPADSALHYLLAAILFDREKNEESMAECRKAIELGFENAAVYITLGDLYYRQMKIAESVESLEKAAEMDPRSLESIASFALAEMTAASRTKLRALLEKAVQANPENINTLYTLGALYLQESELPKAQEIFSKLEVLAPGQSQTAYNLAQIYARLGQTEKAQEAMVRFQKLKQQELQEFDRQNKAHKTRLQADDAFLKKDWAGAARMYEGLVKDGTATQKDYLHLADSLMQMEDFTRAASVLESLLKKPPYDKEAVEKIIETTTALENPYTARVWQQRLEALTCTL